MIASSAIRSYGTKSIAAPAGTAITTAVSVAGRGVATTRFAFAAPHAGNRLRCLRRRTKPSGGAFALGGEQENQRNVYENCCSRRRCVCHGCFARAAASFGCTPWLAFEEGLQDGPSGPPRQARLQDGACSPLTRARSLRPTQPYAPRESGGRGRRQLGQGRKAAATTISPRVVPAPTLAAADPVSRCQATAVLAERWRIGRDVRHALGAAMAASSPQPALRLLRGPSNDLSV